MLYFSIHRYEYGNYWPKLRESDYDYVGEGDGTGFNINVPLNKVRTVILESEILFEFVIATICSYGFGPMKVMSFVTGKLCKIHGETHPKLGPGSLTSSVYTTVMLNPHT